MLVNSLMMDYRIAWDEDVVREIFNEWDSSLILDTPLRFSHHNDRRCWSFDKHV